MVLCSVFLLFFAIQCSLSHGLPELTNDNFDTQIKQKKFMLVMFYAPWCGHCKRLKPDFILAGEELSNHKDVGLALVDCTTQDKICSRFEVTGYPTLKFFKDGNFFFEYEGPRDKNGLKNFVLSRSQPPSHHLESEADLVEFLEVKSKKIDVAVVSFLKSDSEKHSELHHTLSTDMLGQVNFAHTHDANVLGVPNDKSVIRMYRPRALVTKLTDPHVDYDGELKASSVRSWISNEGHGLVGYRCSTTARLFPSDNILIFYHNDSIDMYPKGVNYHRNRVARAVKESGIDTKKLSFVYSYSEDFNHEVNDLQSSPEFPLIVLKSAGKKYKLEEYSRDKLIEFLQLFESGKLEPFIKSEPIPTEQSSPVMKVVAKNFEAIVNDPTKDVFIMFHAPWCGHCQKLKPKLESVATKLKNEPGVLLVAMDATANDIPHPYEVRGYPTLYFVPKSSKHAPKRYEGPREEEDLIKYIAKESTDELEAYDRHAKEKKAEL